ncbi:MAG: 3'-5' exonuclease [Sphingomonas bacterium]|nr:3'-5' exonuclease [Sphingomonas bacterium]
MTDIIKTASTEAVTCACANDPDTKILRRVSSLSDFPLAPRGNGPWRRVAVLDVESTGTDPLTDEIIDIAVVILVVDADGAIVEIESAGQALRDPGVPIPEAITRLTGITDEDVAGKTIDLDRLERRIANADVRIAHNAQFDIAFVENLMPGLAELPWACSMRDFDWIAAGFDGRKLGHLLMQIRRYHDAHRAMADVVSLIHLLAHRLPSGMTVMGELLVNARLDTIRFEATGAPFEKRGLLKSRGYRWDAAKKVWWIEIGDDDYADEQLWLRRYISPYGPSPRALSITWHQRHR